jgi:hypothetical protein
MTGMKTAVNHEADLAYGVGETITVRYFLRYIHAPSTIKTNVVAQRYVSLIPVFLAMN